MAASGCSTAPPAPADAVASATPSDAPVRELILGCTSIAAAECLLAAETVLGEVPPERGPAVAVAITLYGCAAAPVCPTSLAAREGEAIIEFTDGGEPIMFSLAGPPNAPTVVEAPDIGWSGLLLPQSPPAGGPGPFPFEVGHCGLWNSVDFDAGWWIPVGEVDGDIPAMINAEQGQIRMLTPATAEYLGPDGSRVQLARFPGPKHLRLCM